jgi:uncharacterized membrane protein SpoIIM required for sporulation
MKETSFIEQNKEKWKRFEQLSESQTRDPEELSDLYMDITDDLSYAQTFYKRRTVRVYLNLLAQRVYTGLHIQKGESIRKIVTVWKTSLPLEIYRARKNLYFSFAVFVIWAVLGALTTRENPDFAKIVTSDYYVEMTNENIANGNPMAVYQGQDQLSMFVQITTNNIRVAFLTFIFGFFFTIGTHILLFQNAVMLGSFQYFFASKGLLVTSFLAIWIHGAFEISTIVLAGGAGITLGSGWLFPGNYTRLQSLQLSAKRGLKIMLSLVPFLIVAGFLESYVTRHYQDLSEWSKWTLISLSFAIILLYYVIYPLIVARKHPELVHHEEAVNYTPVYTFNLQKIRSFGQIISDTFRFYRLHFAKFFRINLFLIFPLMWVAVVFQDHFHADLMATEHWFDWSKQLEIMLGFGFTGLTDFIISIYWSVLLAGMFLSVLYTFHSLQETFSWRSFFQYVQKHFAAVWLGNLLLFALLMALPWYFYILLVLVLPLFYLNAIVPAISTGTFREKLRLGWTYSSRSYGFAILSVLLFSLIFALFLQPIAFVGSIPDNASAPPNIRDLLDMLSDFVKDISGTLGWDRLFWSNVTRQFVYLFFIITIFPLWIIARTFMAYNEHEKETAGGLKASLKQFGKRSRFKENEIDFD